MAPLSVCLHLVPERPQINKQNAYLLVPCTVPPDLEPAFFSVVLLNTCGTREQAYDLFVWKKNVPNFLLSNPSSTVFNWIKAVFLLLS